MKIKDYYVALTGILLLVGIIGDVRAGKSVIVEQVEKRFDENVFYQLYPDGDLWNDAEKRRMKILGTNLDELEKTAKGIGMPPVVDKTTLYIKDDMFRMDSESPSGERITGIFRKDMGMMYQIDWKTKTMHKISIEQIKEMKKNVEKSMTEMKKSMPSGMEDMLAMLPKEQQDAIMQAMGAEGGSPSEGSGTTTKPELTETGNTKDIKHFSKCVEFKANEGNKVSVIWAYGGKPGLSKLFHETAKEFRDNFEMDKSKQDYDPIDHLPEDKFPVLTVTYEEDMMAASIGFETSEITSVKETEIPLSTFEVYNDPSLTESPIMDRIYQKQR